MLPGGGSGVRLRKGGPCPASFAGAVGAQVTSPPVATVSFLSPLSCLLEDLAVRRVTSGGPLWF